MITLYTRPGCTGCMALKAALERRGVEFRTVDGFTSTGMTEMLTSEPPVCLSFYPALKVGDRLYEYASLIGEKGEVLPLDDILG